jgi:hypothetical protein
MLKTNFEKIDFGSTVLKIKIEGDTVLNILDEKKEIIAVLDISPVPSAHFILIKKGYPQDKNTICGSSDGEKDVQDFYIFFDSSKISVCIKKRNGELLMLTALNHRRVLNEAVYFKLEPYFLIEYEILKEKSELKSNFNSNSVSEIKFKEAKGFYFTSLESNDLSGATIVAISFAIFVFLAIVIGIPVGLFTAPYSGYQNKYKSILY